MRLSDLLGKRVTSLQRDIENRRVIVEALGADSFSGRFTEIFGCRQPFSTCEDGNVKTIWRFYFENPDLWDALYFDVPDQEIEIVDGRFRVFNAKHDYHWDFQFYKVAPMGVEDFLGI